MYAVIESMIITIAANTRPLLVSEAVSAIQEASSMRQASLSAQVSAEGHSLQFFLLMFGY